MRGIILKTRREEWGNNIKDRGTRRVGGEGDNIKEIEGPGG